MGKRQQSEAYTEKNGAVPINPWKDAMYTDDTGFVQLEPPVQMHAFEVLIFSMVRYNYAVIFLKLLRINT